MHIYNSDTGFDNFSADYEDDFEVSKSIQLSSLSNPKISK